MERTQSHHAHLCVRLDEALRRRLKLKRSVRSEASTARSYSGCGDRSRRRKTAPASARPAAPPLVSVYDGQQILGHVLARGKAGFEAFDIEDRSVGMFPTQRQAANALLIAEGGP